jgi:hypothetical protein
MKNSELLLMLADYSYRRLRAPSSESILGNPLVSEVGNADGDASDPHHPVKCTTRAIILRLS